MKAYNGITIREILQKRTGWETWSLYEIYAAEFNEAAARFYLDFHCRLTEHPVSLHPVWPLFIEGNYVIKHNQNNMYMLVEGNVSAVKTFPSVALRQLSHNSSQTRLYEVSCAGRQQLISAGRTRALQYTYLWREPLDQMGIVPKVSVTDLTGADVASGETNVLPHSKTLRIKSSFDGELIISNKSHLVDKRKITADKYTELDGLAFGISIQIMIGFDVVWQINFKKQRSVRINEDVEMLKHITSVSGVTIPAPHSLRNILAGMRSYPTICRWIRMCIKNDVIDEQAYRRLQEAYRRMTTNG